MNTPTGFDYEGKRIRFVDAQGKDANTEREAYGRTDRMERWRADLYYQPNFAKTALFYSELAYETFLAANRPHCFATYDEFSQSRWTT